MARTRTAGLGLLALTAAAVGGYSAFRRPAQASAAASPAPAGAVRMRREARRPNPLPLWHHSPERELRILAVCVLVTALVSLVVVFGVLTATRGERQAASSGLMPATPLSQTLAGPQVAD